MKLIRDTGLLAQRQGRHMLRNPVWLAVGFSTPILYLALFTPLLKHLTHTPGFPAGNVLNTFLPGILSLLAFSSGASAGFGTIFELQAGVIERFRVTPASRFAILLGPILAGTAMMFAFDAVVVAGSAAFGFHINIGGLCALAVLLAIMMVMMSAFSVATALATKEISAFAAIINGINLPLLLLAGVLLPVSLGPLWMRILAHFDPLYYVVTAARALAGGDFSSHYVWQAFTVLIVLCAAVLAGATSVFRKAVA